MDETTGCWLWVGALSGGYATVTRDKRSLKAHRYIYELASPIPFGLHIDHLCRVTRCVNPGHLEPVSAAENNRRAHVTEQCHKGHPWTIENTYTYLWRGCFKRICRACKREYIAEYRARKAAS